MTVNDTLLHFGALKPLRCSALPMLLRCPMRVALEALGEATSDSGVAADTGSAVHEAVRLWHAGTGVAEAMEAARQSGKFPRADWDEVRLHATPYTRDPRNTPQAVGFCELSVEFALPAAEGDPTGEPIRVTGTLDQLRKTPRGWELWDVKTGADEGWVMLHAHAMQLAAYTYAARNLFPEPVHPGGIIRTRGYRKRGAADAATEPDGVFFYVPWEAGDCLTLLRGVRETVKHIRSGAVLLSPGEHCRHCPAGGLEGCLPMSRRVRLCDG